MSLHDGHRKRLDDKVTDRGLDFLKTHEQLEYILFTVIPRGDTNKIAHRLLDRFVSISGVLNAEVSDLMEVEGVGERTARFLTSLPAVLGIVERNSPRNTLPKLDTHEKIINYIKTFFYGKLCEEVYMFCLNSAYRLVAVRKISDGIAGEVYIHPSNVIRKALRVNAAAVVIAHNHPGGTINPSVGDIMMHDKLEKAFSAVEITLSDNVIVTEDGYFSLCEKGYANGLSENYYQKKPPMGMNNSNGF